MNALPRLLLIADQFTSPQRSQAVLEAVEAGVRGIQLRDHKAQPKPFVRAATELVEKIRAINPEAWISINSRPSVARSLETDLHLGKRGPAVVDARQQMGPLSRIGYSAHNQQEASLTGVDYLSFSPIFETPSKPGQEGVGIHALGVFCLIAEPVPVFALGGILPRHVSGCLQAGAWGIAVLSAILNARSPGTATQEYLSALS